MVYNLLAMYPPGGRLDFVLTLSLQLTTFFSVMARRFELFKRLSMTSYNSFAYKSSFKLIRKMNFQPISNNIHHMLSHEKGMFATIKKLATNVVHLCKRVYL
jgi:hypothetical protein